MVEPLDEALVNKHFAALYRRLLFLEEQKHMPPKFSCAVTDLASYYGLLGQRPPSIQSCNQSVQLEASTFFQPDFKLETGIAAVPELHRSTPYPAAPIIW